MEISLIGVDLGKNCAFSLWEHTNCIRVVGLSFSSKRYVYENLLSVFKTVNEIVLRFHPVIAIEKPGRALGIQWIQYMDFRELAFRNRCEFASFSPTEIKKVITGNGRAGKESIINAVWNYCLDPPKDDHQADAIAVALTYLKKRKILGG